MKKIDKWIKVRWRNELLVDDPKESLASLLTIHITSLLIHKCVAEHGLGKKEKRKQHKTIKISRKKRFVNIFCLACEWDFFRVRIMLKRDGDWEQQHMVHLFNVTIKQVILWACSSRYSLLSVDPFLSQGATICFRRPEKEKLSILLQMESSDGFNSRQIIGASSASFLFFHFYNLQLLAIYHNNLGIIKIPFNINRSHVSFQLLNITCSRIMIPEAFVVKRRSGSLKTSCNSIKHRIDTKLIQTVNGSISSY